MKKVFTRILMSSFYGILIQISLGNLLLAITPSNAQEPASTKEIHLSLELENADLLTIFNKIEQLTEFNFVYNSKDIDKGITLNNNYSNTPLYDILIDISRHTKLGFKRVNTNINVKKLPKGEPATVTEEVAAITVSGTVTSQVEGEGLPGVNVMVKGSNIGTITDIDGNYNLNVPNNDDILVFSSIGYTTQEVPVNGRTSIDVAMAEDVQSLEEIVVVGYGTAKKEDLTGAIASVDIENSRDIPNANAVQSLRGTVAGVVVTDNGRPGSDASIQIRGRNSISASNQPLIVLDGVIYAGGRLSDINPGDIESIHVLKDASSTAIYGSLAANGVIEITTKKGAYGKPRLSLNTYYGFSDYAQVPDFLNAQEFLDFRKDAEAADNGPIPFSATEQANIDAGRSIEPFEEIRQEAPVYNGELSVSGRTEFVSYYVSGSYINSKSPVAGDNFSRLAGRVNLNVAATEWLNIGLNSGYSSRDNSGNRADLGAASWLSPWASLYYDDGVPRKQPQDVGLVANPMFSTIWNNREDKSATLFVNSFAEVTLLEGLTYKLNVGYTQRNDHEYIYRPSYDREEFFNLGSGSKEHFESHNLTLENILQYSRFITDDHQVNATLMYGFYETNDETSFLSSQNIFNDALGWNALEIGENFNIATAAGESTQLSAMGRLGYRYKSRYILDVSLRRDGYSAFGEGRKYGLFPAVGLSWNMIEESFLSDVQFLDNLKLRLSWGKNGNRGVDRYSSLSEIVSTNYVFGDAGNTAVGLYPTSFANPNLGWETTTSTNFGVDFGVLNSRLSGSVNYYVSHTTDLLLQQQIPNTNGYDQFLRNVGETENKGIEISLSSVNLNLGDFQWNTGAAFTLNRNKIVKLTGNDIDEDGIEDDDIANEWFIGYPLGANYDYVFDGIYQEGDDFSALPGSQAGHIKFKDVNEDGVITPDDRQVLHSDQPDFILGLTNTFSYKGFSLMTVFNWRKGGYSSNQALNLGRNFYYEANVYDIPYWTPENAINDWPIINYGNPLAWGFYQNRSYVRLQDVSLGYTFPQAIVEKVSISGLKIYLSGKNLFTWTDWIGWDPEHGAGGISPGNNGPLMKTYTVGLNVQF
ncbi:TonB-dependent receptor [Catalinimonas sp. 4WD22]|uniref:SusC/RagA family TonB-linked outer membrane protein n=1 Tax=Catalinimonas locisalis TaxID=3133978 RepID=UPI003100E5A8